MRQYGYIPIAHQGNLPNQNSYIVRIAVFIDGVAPTTYDAQGLGIVNALELEVAQLNNGQKTSIVARNGEWFESCDDYIAWKEYIKNNPQ